MIGPIIAVVSGASVALDSQNFAGVDAAHTIADSFIEVDDRFINANTTTTNTTLKAPTYEGINLNTNSTEPLYRYAEVNGTGSTLPDSVYTQVPVYQDETTRGQPYENSHSSVCEGDCEKGEWTPEFLKQNMEQHVVKEFVNATTSNSTETRTTVPAPTTAPLDDIEVDEEDADYYNYVEAVPKNSTETIEALIASEKAASQLHDMHSKGTSTGMPSTTENLMKSESQIRKEYAAEQELIWQMGAAIATSALLACTGLFAKKSKDMC